MMRYQNGDIFTGAFFDGRPSVGEIIFKEMEESYIGEFKNGVYEGQGIFKFFNGEIYNGGWKDGLMHGNGLFSYPDGSELFGQF